MARFSFLSRIAWRLIIAIGVLLAIGFALRQSRPDEAATRAPHRAATMAAVTP